MLAHMLKRVPHDLLGMRADHASSMLAYQGTYMDSLHATDILSCWQNEGRLVAFVEWDNGASGDYPLFECPFGDAAMGLRATLALHSASFSHAPRVNRPFIPRSTQQAAATAKAGVHIARTSASIARENTYPRADDILAGRRTGHGFYSMYSAGDLMCDQLRYSPNRMFCIDAVGTEGVWQCAYACNQDAYVHTSWLVEVQFQLMLRRYSND
jgi:hypothetical protein